MINVIQRTRELGEAIIASEAYKAMQLAESEAESDPAVHQLESTIAEMTAMLRTAPDPALSSQLEAAKQSLAALPVIRKRDKARSGFSRLMEQVNNILQFTLTGEISALSSCSGNCHACSGCS